jgi:hypothetical protein
VAAEELASRKTLLRMNILADVASNQKCSGLLMLDNNLGENARHREVSDDKAASYVVH